MELLVTTAVKNSAIFSLQLIKVRMGRFTQFGLLPMPPRKPH